MLHKTPDKVLYCTVHQHLRFGWYYIIYHSSPTTIISLFYLVYVFSIGRHDNFFTRLRFTNECLTPLVLERA